jgi:hypothetical protein
MAMNYDLRVGIKAVVTTEKLLQKNASSKESIREGGQGKIALNVSLPNIDSAELTTRLANANLVLQYGYPVDATMIPPIVKTDDATAVTATSATLNGRVTSAGGNATVGFVLGTDANLGLGSVTTNEGSTGGTLTILKRTYSWAGLTPSTKYYYRFFAQRVTGSLLQYGKIRWFTTPAV